MPTLKCCVGGCRNKREDAILHKFPISDESRLTKWLECLNSDDLRVASKKRLVSYYVCSKHFEKRFYSSEKHLKLVAYPSLFTAEEISSGVPSSVKADIPVKCHGPVRHLDHTYSKDEETALNAARIAENYLKQGPLDHTYGKGEEPTPSKIARIDGFPKDTTLLTSLENSQSLDRQSYPSNETKLKKSTNSQIGSIGTKVTDENIDSIICGIDPNYNGIRVKVKKNKHKESCPNEHKETSFSDECVDESLNDVDQSYNDVDRNSETPPLKVTDSDLILLEDADQPGPIILLDGDQQGLMDESQLDVDLHVEEEQSEVHHHHHHHSPMDTYICDGCGAVISGARYACVQCECDECVTCASSGPQHPHYVLRVPNTANNCEARAVIAAVRRIVRDCLDPPQVKIEVKDEEDSQPEYYIEELDSDSAILHLRSNNIQQNSDEETDIPSRLCIPDTNIHPETTSSTKTRPQTIHGRTRSSVKNSTSVETSKANNTIKIKTRVPNPLKNFREPAKSTDNFIIYSSVTEDGVSINLTPVCNETNDPINITPGTVNFAPNSANIDPTAIKFAPVPVDFAPIQVRVAPNAVEFTPGRYKYPHVPIIVRPHPYKHTRRKDQNSDLIMLADLIKPVSVRLDRLDPATIAAVTSTCDSGLRRVGD